MVGRTGLEPVTPCVSCKDGTVTAEVAFNIAMRFSSLSLGFVWQNDDAVATRLQRYFEPEALLA